MIADGRHQRPESFQKAPEQGVTDTGIADPGHEEGGKPDRRSQFP